MYRLSAFFMVVLCLTLTFNASATVQTGLDRLFGEHLSLIEGKNVALIGNHTSVDAEGVHLLDRLAEHSTVVAAFGPEHGFEGNRSAGDKISDMVRDGLNIYSLYGTFRVPTPEQLKDVDVLIYDIQDVGVKFYTYISSLFLGMHAAKREGIPIIVLDRPNPVDATRVEGAITHPAYSSFVGVIPLPARYGMTVGELAHLFNKETYAGFALNADLHVIEMSGYKRGMPFEETGVEWLPPSPNMPTVETALIYPGTCLIEGTNLSEGRGTDSPFQIIGAPFIDAEEWLSAIPEEYKKGFSIETITFMPRSIPGKSENPKHKDAECEGIFIEMTDVDVAKPIDLTIAMLVAVQSLYPEEFSTRSFMDRLWGNEDLRAMLAEGNSAADILATIPEGIRQFESVRSNYLIYPR